LEIKVPVQFLAPLLQQEEVQGVQADQHQWKLEEPAVLAAAAARVALYPQEVAAPEQQVKVMPEVMATLKQEPEVAAALEPLEWTDQQFQM
jgi:hypothetical protein